AHLARAREWADRRRVRGPGDPMSRLYAIEPALTVTGGAADHRVAVRDGSIPAIAAALLVGIARELGSGAPGGSGASGARSPSGAPSAANEAARASAWSRDLAARLAAPTEAASAHASVVDAIARDLARHRGRSAVLAGDRQPPPVHAAAAAMNAI